MGKLMIQCPKTRRALFTGRYVDAESFRYSPVFFSRTYCEHCKLVHEWFAREAWVCTMDCARREITCECRARRVSESAAA